MRSICLLFSLFILGGFINESTAKRKTLGGVEYETYDDNTATAKLTVQAIGDVSILEFIELGKHRYFVTTIEEAYFKKNKWITSVILPKSMKVIKTGAFRGCSNLSKIIFPEVVLVIEKDAFAGCENIKELEGNTAPYLAYIRNNGEKDKLNMIKRPEMPTFSVFSKNSLSERMELWQMKKSYETEGQYKNRITEENRKKRMHEFEEDLKKEYVTLYKPNKISTHIETYDSEYEKFMVSTLYYGDLFVHVPKSDASKFRTDYSKVEVCPEFGVLNDSLAILSCEFQLDGKVYSTSTNPVTMKRDNLEHELAAGNTTPSVGENAINKKKSVFVDNEIDINIPQTTQDNELTFALIIGNENYEHEQLVSFASNDAKVFSEYCKHTLGLPDKNVTLLIDAGLNRMRHDILRLVNILKAFDGEAKAIVYYAGHGLPDENERTPYLLPTDGFAADVKSGYSLSDLYKELASAPSQMTMVFLDACFSGARRDGQMLAESRGVAIKARNTIPNGNLMVFSASQGDETAYSDRKHRHGMFTYYLLKHLQETKGDTSIGDLSDFVITNVKRNSVIENNGKIQTPSMIPSLNMMNSWKEVKLR